eukprot:7058907-Ditylum_brightwellii.AAC.1
MPRKGSCNCFCHHECNQKHVYKNEKLGCGSRDDIEEVIREENGVEMGDSIEKENNNNKESESEKRKKKKTRKIRDLKKMR